MITQDNELIAAAYSMTFNEKRLILLALSKIDPHASPDQQGKTPLSVKVTIKDWGDVYGGRTNSYKQAYDAAESLWGKGFTPPGQDHEFMWLDRRPLERPKNGHIWIHFGYSLSLYITGAKYWTDGFTQYRLEDMAKLPNFPSIRLYEELARFKSTGVRNLSMDELRQRIDPEGQYPRYADLNRRVIKPGIESINKKTNLSVKFEIHRQGRTVTGYTFRISQKRG